MLRVITAILLVSSVLLVSVTNGHAQKKFEFEVWTILASNYQDGFGGDLVLVKKYLRKTGYSSFALLNERKLKIKLGDTFQIPIPGGSTFAISPKIYIDKKAYIDVYLTGEDKDFSFYDSPPVTGTLAGKAFISGNDDTICLIGPQTRWGALVFIVHEIDM